MSEKPELFTPVALPTNMLGSFNLIALRFFFPNAAAF